MAAREVLLALKSGALDVEQALEQLATEPFRQLEAATVDHHRALRQGVPEVIFGQGKSPEQIVAIAKALLEGGQNVLVTRIEPAAAAELQRQIEGVQHNPVGRVARIEPRPALRRPGVVAIVTAGTSDIPVAEEARETLEAIGICAERVFDVGVAGIHRLLHRMEQLRKASAVVVIAGMEGALPSVVGGMVSAPVIAVPTSVGYGTALDGFTPLFAMLTSCASGVTVVNIDNGFGAAFAVHRILSASERIKTSDEPGG